jgi:two-component system, chemotaxis family, protein-glutamate methylesterase/glutaminase
MPRSNVEPAVTESADAGRAAPSAAKAPRGYDLVVIGGSAGGIEVLKVLLGALPAHFGAAVMIVSHLPAASPSYLVPALAHRCALPVLEPDAGELIVPGRVHVAPAGYHMLVEVDRTVALSTDAAVRFSRPSIDVLFDSAAQVYGERLLGVLLSGANDDGAHGLERVRAQGGTAWVQEPASAASPEMPRAAIARGAADAVYNPETLAQRLAALPTSL